MGIVCEILANNCRKPIWGYKSLVYSVFAIGFLSFIVWAHHMYLTGMGTAISTFFQTTTMMFVLAFLPMFGIGGLTGLPLVFNFVYLMLHDTKLNPSGSPVTPPMP